jgi:serine/threonine protein kinase
MAPLHPGLSFRFTVTLDRRHVLAEHFSYQFRSRQFVGVRTSVFAGIDLMKYCPACHRTYPADYNVCPADQSPLQSAHELQPGMVIRSKYEILERIGIGGMGFVYKGRHITFNELCAIKIVNDVIAGDANFLQRFQTEAVVTRKLRHPNAVRVEDFDYTEDGRPFIVMELVEGKNVGETLQSDGPFRVPRAIRIAIQVAQALGLAHKLGIVHRDIKPGNIILTTDEQGQEVAKVLDFGIAKLREAVGDAKPGMTMTGMVVGTPLYMSPEQFMGKKAGAEIDGRSDIYSLGVVLYQMVTARLPFDGDTLYSIMMQHMQGDVCPPHEIAPELQIPESLSRVILKAIDKSREQRYQTAEEFAAALQQVASAGAAVSERGFSDANIPAFQATFEQPSRAIPLPNAPSVPKGTLVPTVPDRARPANKGNVAEPTNPAPVIPSSLSTQPAATQPVAVSAATPDSLFIQSAEQHVLVQPRKFGIKNLVMTVVLFMAVVVVAGVGYLKYQAFRRVQIENAVNEKLSSAPSASLRSAAIHVFVSDRREVTLDGDVASQDDSSTAESLVSSVPGVVQVSNRLRIAATAPSAQTTGQSGTPADAADSLIQKGVESLDAGDYPSAIDSFTKAAAADPSNHKAQEWTTRARQAQKTEEELLKNRH